MSKSGHYNGGSTIIRVGDPRQGKKRKKGKKGKEIPRRDGCHHQPPAYTTEEHLARREYEKNIKSETCVLIKKEDFHNNKRLLNSLSSRTKKLLAKNTTK